MLTCAHISLWGSDRVEIGTKVNSSAVSPPTSPHSRRMNSQFSACSCVISFFLCHDVIPRRFRVVEPRIRGFSPPIMLTDVWLYTGFFNDTHVPSDLFGRRWTLAYRRWRRRCVDPPSRVACSRCGSCRSRSAREEVHAQQACLLGS